jgi:hypothetical protein
MDISFICGMRQPVGIKEEADTERGIGCVYEWTDSVFRVHMSGTTSSTKMQRNEKERNMSLK